MKSPWRRRRSAWSSRAIAAATRSTRRSLRSPRRPCGPPRCCWWTTVAATARSQAMRTGRLGIRRRLDQGHRPARQRRSVARAQCRLAARGPGLTSRFSTPTTAGRPRKLELQMEALRADPQIALIAHRMTGARSRIRRCPHLRPPVRTAIVRPAPIAAEQSFSDRLGGAAPRSAVPLQRELPPRRRLPAVGADRVLRLPLRQDRPDPGLLAQVQLRRRRAQRRPRRDASRPAARRAGNCCARGWSAARNITSPGRWAWCASRAAPADPDAPPY